MERKDREIEMDQIQRQSASVRRMRQRLIISNARAQQAQYSNQSLRRQVIKANLRQCLNSETNNAQQTNSNIMLLI